MIRVRLLAFALSLLFSLSIRPAQADNAKEQCAFAFEQGQRFQIVGDLQRAIQEFESCAGNSCPAAAQQECSRLLEVAQAAIPAIQFDLAFRDGLLRRLVMLSIDEGEPEAYDGEVLRVNPGKHSFVFECEGCATVTRRITLAEQDSKHKEVVLNPACGDADAAATAAASRTGTQSTNCPAVGVSAAAVPRSALERAPLAPVRHSAADDARLRDTVILGSTAALATVGAIGFVGFGLAARSGERALSECTTYCSGAQIAEVKRSYWLANVSLGTGLVALGGATIWWFGLRPSSHSARSAGQWSIELGPINKLTRSF